MYLKLNLFDLDLKKGNILKNLNQLIRHHYKNSFFIKKF